MSAPVHRQVSAGTHGPQHPFTTEGVNPDLHCGVAMRHITVVGLQSWIGRGPGRSHDGSGAGAGSGAPHFAAMALHRSSLASAQSAPSHLQPDRGTHSEPFHATPTIARHAPTPTAFCGAQGPVAALDDDAAPPGVCAPAPPAWAPSELAVADVPGSGSSGKAAPEHAANAPARAMTAKGRKGASVGGAGRRRRFDARRSSRKVVRFMAEAPSGGRSGRCARSTWSARCARSAWRRSAGCFPVTPRRGRTYGAAVRRVPRVKPR